MPTLTATSLHDEAARRLGRDLTEGELAVDMAANDRALEHGKERLRAAIEAEKVRVIRQTVRHGETRPLQITPAMLAALIELYNAGQASARREMAALGVEPVRALAQEEIPPDLAAAVSTLRTHLGSITTRIQVGAADEALHVGLGALVQGAIERALIRKVPGPRDAASRLVSGAFARGLQTGFEPSLALFPGWTYSAMMDAATCATCAYFDGQQFDTWDAIGRVLPNGGPNPGCFGDGRCRCRPVPVGPA